MQTPMSSPHNDGRRASASCLQPRDPPAWVADIQARSGRTLRLEDPVHAIRLHPRPPSLHRAWLDPVLSPRKAPALFGPATFSARARGKKSGSGGHAPLTPMVCAETTGFSAGAVAHRAEARALTAQPHLAAVDGIGGRQAHRAEARAFTAQPHLAAVDGIGGRQAHRAEARAFTAQPHSANIRNAGRAWTDFNGKTRFVPLHRHVIISPAPATYGAANVLLTPQL